MKIVDRKTFLELPENTLFSKYEPCMFGALSIKGISLTDDFFYLELENAIGASDTGEFFDRCEAASNNGKSIAVDLETESRDALFYQSQKFAIWERDDIAALITRLSECLKD